MWDVILLFPDVIDWVEIRTSRVDDSVVRTVDFTVPVSDGGTTVDDFIIKVVSFCVVAVIFSELKDSVDFTLPASVGKPEVDNSVRFKVESCSVAFVDDIISFVIEVVTFITASGELREKVELKSGFESEVSVELVDAVESVFDDDVMFNKDIVVDVFVVT